MALKLSQQAFILVAVPLAFEICFGGILAVLLFETQLVATQENEQRNVLFACDNLKHEIEEAGLNLHEYKLNRNQTTLKKYQSSVATAQNDIATLKNLLADKPEFKSSIARVEKFADDGLKLVDELKQSVDEGRDVDSPDAALPIQMAVLAKTREMTACLREISATQRSLPRPQWNTESLRALVWQMLVAAMGANIALAGILTFLFQRSTTKRLNTLMENIVKTSVGEMPGARLDPSDEIGKIDAAFRDMAVARAESIRKERAVIENALDAFCTIDSNLKFTALNPASRDVFGYQANELIGTRLTEIIYEEDRDNITRALKRSIAGEPEPLENRVKRKDGREGYIRWTIQWSPEERNLYCVAHDMSSRREASRLKKEFVSILAGDLKGPLVFVRDELDAMSALPQGVLPERALGSITDARSNLAYSVGMIDGLLDVEEMTSGQIGLNKRQISLGTVFQRAELAVRSFAEGKAIGLVVPACDIEVVADEERLVHVLLNLVSNAVKFSGKGSTIKIIVQNSPGDVTVKVQDEGQGVPKEVQSKIFERFQQGSADDARMRGGVGLGLSICKSLIEAHGGEIGVESDGVNGSTFWFVLPKGNDRA